MIYVWKSEYDKQLKLKQDKLEHAKRKARKVRKEDEFKKSVERTKYRAKHGIPLDAPIGRWESLKTNTTKL